MKDDAVAPVIAVMLILAAIVTFFSIYNAIYVPSMKESSEVGHLHNVEESFEKFSSDIDYAASSHQNYLTFSEPVQLGGGDFMFNLLKSSGTLSVVQDRNTSRVSENTIYNLTFYANDDTTTSIGSLNGTLVNFSYEPTSNFWQDQGYQWQYGYINITKYGGMLKTPLSYDTMDNVTNAIESGSLLTFAKSFATVDYTVNTTPPQGNTNPGGNCSSLDLVAVNITASPDHSFISSNGYGTLKLTSNVNSTPFPSQITNITFMSDQEPFGNATVDNLNETLFKVSTVCGYNINPDPSGTNTSLHQYQYDITQTEDSPINVNLTVVEIQIEAY
jgi:hypothetical protein